MVQNDGLGPYFSEKKKSGKIFYRKISKNRDKVGPKSRFLKNAISGFTRFTTPHSKFFPNFFFLPKKFGFDVLSNRKERYSTIDALFLSLEFFPPGVS